MTDIDLAAEAAEAAGRMLVALRNEGRLEGRALGDAGDRAANALILAILSEHRPEDAILSEESCDDLARLERSRLWVVDPLDGTREYREGRADWAVHVALAVDGVPTLGAVAIPALGEVFRSDGPCVTTPTRSPRMAVSRTRPPKGAAELADFLGAEMVAIGSAGAKAMAVVRGDVDLYFHAGGQHEWDNCAPAAVAIGAGLKATRIDGAPLRYNLPDAKVPDLIIAREELWAPAVAFASSRLSI